MKAAIVYASNHHLNTKKVVDAIAKQTDIKLIDACTEESSDLSHYEVIGFASGIIFSKYYPQILNYAEENLPDSKKVFFIHTAGDPRENQNAGIKAITEKKGCEYLGTYCCKGFDTYGPFKLIGGINKSRPNEDDIAGAVAFAQNIGVVE